MTKHANNKFSHLLDGNTMKRGPLLVCLSLALILTTRAPAKETSHVFTTVFVVMWTGSLVVTVNAQLLGATISIFQSVCVSYFYLSVICGIRVETLTELTKRKIYTILGNANRRCWDTASSP